MNQYEREEEQLEQDLRSGLVTQAEYNKLLRDMQRAMQDEARGAAERAYRDEMERW